MKTTKKKKVLKEYNVDIQFHSYDLDIKAYSAADAIKPVTYKEQLLFFFKEFFKS